MSWISVKDKLPEEYTTVILGGRDSGGSKRTTAGYWTYCPACGNLIKR